MGTSHAFSQEFPIPAGGATLTFNTWYDIQRGYDYGYVAVSTDGGPTWTAVEGDITTTYDPHGNNIGTYGITGKSGGWVSASFDLSAYAGQTVLVMLIYHTDGSVNHAGWAIDDIAILEVGFFDDVEAGYDGWSRSRWDITDRFRKTRVKDIKVGIPHSRERRSIGP
jgi:bacillopeptidase F (M6 metalloprotease family)